MRVKIIEIRDAGTSISALCIDMNPENEEQRYYLRKHGYPCDGRANIVLTHVTAASGRATNDPYAWGGRTYSTAHHYIIEHWSSLSDGSVVDVEHILGETAKAKLSERLETLT